MMKHLFFNCFQSISPGVIAWRPECCAQSVQRSVLVDVDLQEAEMMRRPRLSLLLATVFLISLALSETHKSQEDKQEITQDAVQVRNIITFYFKIFISDSRRSSRPGRRGRPGTGRGSLLKRRGRRRTTRTRRRA